MPDRDIRGSDRVVRVAHVIDQLAAAGAQRVMLRNIEALRPPMFEHLVYPVFPDDALLSALDRLGVPVIDLGATRARDFPRAIIRLWGDLRRTCPDIVHTEVFPADVVGRIAARLAGIPVISTFHNPVSESTRLERSGWVQNLMQLVTFRASGAHAVAVSKAVERSVRSSLGARRVTVIPSVVIDRDRWPPVTGSERTSARARCGIREDAFVVGCIARIAPQKGQAFLVRALERCDHRIHTLLIGDGPDRAKIERLAVDLGLRDRVSVTGWLADPRVAVAACDALVLPSLWEGYPLALLEGMSARLPYVVTDVGGVAEIVVHETHALVVPPGDVTALAAALDRIRQDARLRERLIEAASARTHELVTSHDGPEALGALYRSVALRR